MTSLLHDEILLLQFFCCVLKWTYLDSVCPNADLHASIGTSRFLLLKRYIDDESLENYNSTESIFDLNKASHYLPANLFTKIYLIYM